MAPIFIDRNVATHQNVQRGLGVKAKQSRLTPKENNGKLTTLIFECEIKMPGRCAAQVRYFTFDPTVRIGSFDMPTDCCNKSADRPDSPWLWFAIGREEQS